MSQETVIGEINLGSSNLLKFTTWIWRGKLYGGFMKHVATQRYTGGTEAKMMLDHGQAKALAAVLDDMQAPGKKLAAGNVAEIKISSSESIVVQFLPGDEPGELPKIDVRVYQTDDKYTGFTKKGIRFGWDKLGAFATLVSRLGAALGRGDALAAGHAPATGQERHEEKSATHEPPRGEPALRLFPEDFLPPGNHEASRVEIGDLPLKIATSKVGKLIVRNDIGFNHEIRSENEGKFFLYAQMRGKSSIALPAQPLVIFKAVAAYEVYCRELKATWTATNMKGYPNRELAVFRAIQRLQQAGLPDSV